MASRIKGINRLRRTLRRMEPEIRKEVQTAIADTAEAIKQDAIAGAPVEDGNLVRSIDVSFSSDRLAAIIGPGAKAARAEKRATSARRRGRKVTLSKNNRNLLFQMSKARWYEFGTKGVPGHHKPQPPRPFMGPAFFLNEEYGKGLVRKAVKRALEKVKRK